MSLFQIRFAVKEDAAALSDLVKGIAIYHGDDPDPVAPDNVLRHMILSPHIHVLVAEQEGLIGYIAASPTYESSEASPGFYISDFYVVEAQRGTGVGRALLAAMTAHAKRSGFEHIWLTAAEKNRAAQQWYEKIANIRAPVMAYALTADTFDDLSRDGETYLKAE